MQNGSTSLSAENAELRAALRACEARFSRFLEAEANACLFLDRDLKCLCLNEAAASLIGIPIESARGKPLRELVPGIESTPRYASYLEVLAGRGTIGDEDYSPGGPFGERRFRAKAFRAADGLGLIWSDITAEKRTEERLSASQSEIGTLASHLLQAREDERKRVAREIHDELGQSLTAIDMELRWMAHRHEDAPQAIRLRIDAMLAQTAGALGTLRRIVSDLRPGVLDQLGLRAAIEWYAADFSRRTMIDAKAGIGIDEGHIGERTATALFRITQEAMTNAARHARASRIEISLREEEGAIRLEVSDDGVGITEAQASGPDTFGIQGMRERARELGGDASVKGEAGRGTWLSAVIPLPPEGRLP